MSKKTKLVIAEYVLNRISNPENLSLLATEMENEGVQLRGNESDVELQKVQPTLFQFKVKTNRGLEFYTVKVAESW